MSKLHKFQLIDFPIPLENVVCPSAEESLGFHPWTMQISGDPQKTRNLHKSSFVQIHPSLPLVLRSKELLDPKETKSLSLSLLKARHLWHCFFKMFYRSWQTNCLNIFWCSLCSDWFLRRNYLLLSQSEISVIVWYTWFCFHCKLLNLLGHCFIDYY